MGHQFNRLLVLNVLRSELISRHLVDALAELADSVRYDRNSLKHLPRDRIDYVEQLDDHLFVELLLTGVRDH